jgi:hypothetical protein
LRYRNGSQNTDDDDNDHQFDQRETLLQLFHDIPFQLKTKG